MISSRRTNPATRGIQTDTKLDEAGKLLADFSGHKPTEVVRAPVKSDREGLIFGELQGVLYQTERDGKIEDYVHRFRKKSRPLLAASHDGTQLHIVGGQYEFTEAGIEDR